MSREQIEERLLAIVSERTGYPADMLSLEADLEGDLGIDSIKRVEIAGTFTQDLPEAQREAIDVEELTASKTLQAVIEALEAAISGHPPAVAAASGADTNEGAQRPFRQGPAEEERIGRFVVAPTSAPAITATAGLASAGAIVIADDEGGVGEQLADALKQRGEHVLLIEGERVPSDPEAAAWLLEELRGHGGAKALVHLGALGTGGERYGGLEGLLTLCQVLHDDLQAAALAGGAVVLAATRLGGSFGTGETAGPIDASKGAVTGFVKTLAHEWPEVRVKCLDLSPEGPAERDAEHVLAELGAADGLVEVGYRDGLRTCLELRAVPLSERPGEPALDSGSVVLVTGGARGITARVALALAERHRPTLVLVGRTSDEPESAETAALPGLPELRSAAIEDRRREGRPLTPALIEKDCLRILRGREVRDNLQRLRETGARVEYLICDVGEEAAFGALIDSVYEQHGRIDGVIHGAGVIEDKLICDKQPDSLGRVLSAKAGAAQTLAARLRPATLRFMVLFSSVSGRFGNRGQADYAAASEVLGKLAHDLDRRWPARVVAVDWGPWRSTGMVSAALEEEFARRGVALIGLEQGSRLLLEELERGRRGEAEIVIGAAEGLAGQAAGEVHEELAAVRTRLSELPLLAAAEPIGQGEDRGPGPLLRARYNLDLERDLYLGDHRIDGRPVLPFAVAMEMMAEAGVAASGDRLAGLREIRLLDGVALEQDRPVVLDVQVSRPGAAGLEVTIGPSGGGRSHYRAVVALRPAGAGATVKRPDPPALAAPRPLSVSIEEAYRELLFHGPLFQGIVAIDSLDEGGASAVLRGSEPARCVAGAEGRRWLLDPVLIDSALQVQVLWARLQWDVTLLPAQIGAYVAADAAAPGERVRHELRLRAESSAPLCHANHWFFGEDGRLLGILEDVVGVGAKALNRLAGAQP